jgi:precorrin-3B synthase
MAGALPRTRGDRCPGVLRPWPAEDGLLVRLRLVGGRLRAATLVMLVRLAEEYGDGRVHLTSRANLQLRALPGADGRLATEVVRAIEATGLLPSRSHELARNVLVSPQTGLSADAGSVLGSAAGSGAGRADLRPVAAELDRLLCASPALAGLPGRFLFVLDDGRGDLLDRSCDLGLVALSATEAQLRIGDGRGPVVPLPRVAAELVALAEEFVARRGSGPEAAWHVRELGRPLRPESPADPRLPAPAPALPFGPVAGGRHVAVPDGVGSALAAELAAQAAPPGELIVTPWRGVLVPDPTPRPSEDR